MTFSFNNFGRPTPTAASQADLYANNTGSTLSQYTPVKITSTGLATLSLSSPTDVEAMLGLVAAAIPNTQTGSVIGSGAFLNVNSLGFTAGDGVWIASNGQALTNVPPQLGANGFVAGMFVIKIGTIRQNLTVPLQQDLVLQVQNRGSL